MDLSQNPPSDVPATKGEEICHRWNLLSKNTSLREGAVCDASMELRENGFFDKKNHHELGHVTLTPKQFKRTFLGTSFVLLCMLIRQSRIWQLIAIIFSAFVAVVLWFISGLAYDFVKWVISTRFGDFFKSSPMPSPAEIVLRLLHPLR
jgi:hypothetical protein